MSIKLLVPIQINDKKYKKDEIVTQITKKDALRLVKKNIALIENDKFIESSKQKNIKRIIRNRNKEESCYYEK